MKTINKPKIKMYKYKNIILWEMNSSPTINIKSNKDKGNKK